MLDSGNNALRCVRRFARQRIYHSTVSSDSEIEMIAYFVDLADSTRTYEPR
jgi:hypothetical protein